MATINIGRIKFVWQGAYSGGSSYVPDDIVSYNGSSYVCTASTTGNLPTNTTYWSVMASKGTDGTDITSISGLAQGDILYYDGSNWVRLGAGTAGQVLQTGGAGANPSWGTVSSDFVKLGNVTATGTSSSLYLDGYFSSTYDVYKYFVKYMYASTGNGDTFHLRMNDSAGSQYNNTTYKYTTTGSQVNAGSAGSQFPWGWQADSLAYGAWSTDKDDAGAFELTIFNPLDTTMGVRLNANGSRGENGYLYNRQAVCFIDHPNATFTGWSVVQQSGGNIYADIDIYGLK